MPLENAKNPPSQERGIELILPYELGSQHDSREPKLKVFAGVHSLEFKGPLADKLFIKIFMPSKTQTLTGGSKSPPKSLPPPSPESASRSEIRKSLPTESEALPINDSTANTGLPVPPHEGRKSSVPVNSSS